MRNGIIMNYEQLNRTLESLTDGVPYIISNLANASALIFDSLEGLNWAGFYISRENGDLYLGPFQGKTACIEIPLGKGVCGTAASLMTTVVVPNVHEFEGHIACDSASNSEIVIPVMVRGKVFGVLDIDSVVFDRFKDEDRTGLEEFVGILEKRIEKGI